MHTKRLLIAFALLAALALPACAGRQEPQKAPEKNGQKNGQKNGGGGGKEQKEDPVKSGAKKMRSELDELRTAVQAGDAAAARKSTQELDATWEKIEGKVHSQDPETYEKIERPLHAVIAGVGVSPLDQNVVGDQIDVLDEQLAQLNKSKSNGGGGGNAKVDMQTGAAAMRYNLAVVSESLEKDTATAAKAVKAADETWEKFQAAVKKQDKDAYAKIEEAMHNLLAASQESPVDKQKVKEQLPKLDAELAGLLK